MSVFLYLCVAIHVANMYLAVAIAIGDCNIPKFSDTTISFLDTVTKFSIP